jgi:ribosomal protein S18 acetylase RimI-like enzyme
MELVVAPFEPKHLEAVVRLSLRAWEPVFVSIREALDPEVYREQYPDWRADQARAVEAACSDAGGEAWTALADGEVAGFYALKFHRADRIGEIHMIAVDPDYQRRGFATVLTRHALDRMKKAGMTTAMVETGGDPGHAPARATYEATGFRLFPVAKYFRKL